MWKLNKTLASTDKFNDFVLLLGRSTIYHKLSCFVMFRVRTFHPLICVEIVSRQMWMCKLVKQAAGIIFLQLMILTLETVASNFADEASHIKYVTWNIKPDEIKFQQVGRIKYSAMFAVSWQVGCEK